MIKLVRNLYKLSFQNFELKRNRVKSKIELEKEREISIKLRFPSFESKLYRFVSLLRSLHCCHFSSRASSIQNVNVEILLIGFTEPVVFYVTTSLPLIRFNQFGLFFPSLPSFSFLKRNDISRTVSIVTDFTKLSLAGRLWSLSSSFFHF